MTPRALALRGRCEGFADQDLRFLQEIRVAAKLREERPEVRYGLTTMCIGIGMGGTVIWENPNWEGNK